MPKEMGVSPENDRNLLSAKGDKSTRSKTEAQTTNGLERKKTSVQGTDPS